MPSRKKDPARRKASNTRAKKATVQTDASSEDLTVTTNDDYYDDDDGPFDSASTSGLSNNQAPVPPVPKKANLQARTRSVPQPSRWADNSVGDEPVINNGMHSLSGPGRYRQQPPQPPQPPMPRPSTNSRPDMGYPSNDVQYHAVPDMYDMVPDPQAFKVMEQKAKDAEKQRENEALIRRDAEEAFHRRMEDMHKAQEEAKKEIKKARLEAEWAARDRLKAEKDSEEKESRRLKEFAEKLERDVRAKVELEKIAEMAEREAKAKQSEDLERLAKLKMLKSMDEIVVLAKKRVLNDVATQGELSVGATEEPGWLIERRNDTEGENNLSSAEHLGEKSRTSITRSNIPPRHATALTVRSASSASVRRPDV
ncbi:Reticulocyte-binding 2 like a [Fusarium albosuccineum]|uniref:Reticulocyte-binding 2 like a n=1 Tax=Fusarium albosuccineum TaxID=1237068 RepID=A0A8H4PBC7_9HYPO|nr:Reticulocyte-binding 2 like a [Fusarium albosuccineum]